MATSKKPVVKKASLSKTTKKSAVKAKLIRSAKKAPRKVEIVRGDRGTKKTTKAFMKAHAVKIDRNIFGMHALRFNPKRVAYMVLAIILGLLLGNLMHDFLEILYLKKLSEVGITPELHRTFGLYYFLPSFVVFVFLVGGVALGIWLGINGWRWVYVEGRGRTKRK